ncbi:TonB-dependent receptor [Prevotella sp. 10(H)]|uniref:TonB-dependent receptor n=1 Tax=Prevotella sp. 10(H) TaxID=1158294 RepID=UPI0018CC7213|nr:TonB-dependent receptor [Prevotella sp. 10(H)]
MKLMVVFLTLFSLNVSATMYSQTKMLTLDVKNKTIKEVLHQIENQSQFRFIYENENVDFDKKISIRVKDQTVVDVLNLLFQKEGVDYVITEKNLILINPTNKRSEQAVNQPDEIKQGIAVSGMVTDESGEPMIGASVTVKGSTVGVMTDENGRFNFTVQDRSAVLQFSFIGYLTQEIPVANRSVFNITLIEDNRIMEEVIVVGYGVQKKASAVGAISSIKGESLTTTPALNLASGLAGKASGLMAINRSGEPGNDGAILRIRGQNTMGNNDPLIVVDGVANRQGGLDRIDPADIESISILKDASAAIYGAQAANGVILVTTKKGKTGRPQVTYSYNQGFAKATRYPEMADAATYATMMNELAYYRGNSDVYTPEEIQKFRDGSDPWLYPNTDWFDIIMKDLSPQHKQNLTINGGTDYLKYYVSAGNIGQDGFYENSGTRYDQWNLRSNFDIKFSEFFNLGVGINAREEKKKGLTQSNYYEVVMKAKPTQIGFWPNGLPGPAVEGNNNPAIGASKDAGYNRTKDYYIQTNFKLEVKNPWIKELKFTTNVAYDKRMQYTKQFRKLMTTYNWDKISYDENGVPVLVPYIQASNQADPDLNQSTSDATSLVLNALLQYDKRFDDIHNLSVLVGTESNKHTSDFFSAYRRYYISDAIDELFAGGDKDKDNNGYSSESTRQNYFGRLNYSFKDRYLFEFVGRYDGSYIFPKKGRYGFFPGFMVGWVASEEDFWKEKLPLINYFKLRGSWGQTGNDRIDPYQFLSSFRYSSENLILGENIENKAIYSSRIGNPDVTWEVANQANIAFEAQMFRGKLAFGMDFFYNKRSQMLITRNASIPKYTGMTLPRENIGRMENKGFDFDITYHGQIDKVGFTLTANGGYAKNKILFWDEAANVEDHQRSTGHPINTNLYYRALGIFKNQEEVDKTPHFSGARPGDVIFEDVNGDDVIDSKDRVRIDRNSVPTFTGSFTASFNYRDFDLMLMFQGAAGASAYVKTFSGQVGNYLKEEADNRWTESNPNAKYPRAYNRDEEYWRSQPNTFFLKSTDYIRLKNIELGYRLPKSLIGQTPIKDVRIYVSGFNLLTFDKLKVFDPEGDNQTGQFYPQQKVYNIGASITF